MAYGQQLLPDIAAQMLFLAILQLSVHPYFLAMMPIICIEMGHFVPHVATKMTASNPVAMEQAFAMVNKYMPGSVGLSVDDWMRMSSKDKWNIFYTLV